jgi:hypothetical protein
MKTTNEVSNAIFFIIRIVSNAGFNVHTYCLMIPSNVVAGTTPDWRQTDFPSLNKIKVGTDLI